MRSKIWHIHTQNKNNDTTNTMDSLVIDISSFYVNTKRTGKRIVGSYVQFVTFVEVAQTLFPKTARKE